MRIDIDKLVKYKPFSENFSFWKDNYSNRLKVQVINNRKFIKYIEDNIDGKWACLGIFYYFEKEEDRDLIYVAYSMSGLENIIKEMKVCIDESVWFDY